MNSALFVVSSYRDFLKEEIEVHRLMLYRDEFPSLEPSGCLHNQNVLAKIKQLENELSDFEDQLAA